MDDATQVLVYYATLCVIGTLVMYFAWLIFLKSFRQRKAGDKTTKNSLSLGASVCLVVLGMFILNFAATFEHVRNASEYTLACKGLALLAAILRDKTGTKTA